MRVKLIPGKGDDFNKRLEDEVRRRHEEDRQRGGKNY